MSDTVISTGGWICGQCGAWVPSGETHVCPTSIVETIFPPSTGERIARALERIAAALEKW